MDMELIKNKIQDNSPKILLALCGLAVALAAVGVVLTQNGWKGF